jgi:hypothetical protein
LVFSTCEQFGLFGYKLHYCLFNQDNSNTLIFWNIIIGPFDVNTRFDCICFFFSLFSMYVIYRHDITEILLKVALNTIKPNYVRDKFYNLLSKFHKWLEWRSLTLHINSTELWNLPLINSRYWLQVTCSFLCNV